ncbi:MAG: aminoglycoside phosphotransferase family protein [Dehalococcoidia bacterium]
MIAPEPILPRAVQRALASELGAVLPAGWAARVAVAGTGWDVVAWRVPALDGDWLVRVPRHDGALDPIEDQTCLMRALVARGLPVPTEPRMLRGAQGRALAGVYRFVDGGPAVPRGSAERDRLARHLGAFVSRLHAVDPATLEGCRVRRYQPWRDEFAPMVERVAPTLPSGTAAWLRGRAERLAELSTRLPPLVLVHADLKPNHVLLDGTGAIAGVLDFEGIPVTDPAFEFSRIAQNWDAGLARRVLAHYALPADPELMVRAQAYLDFDVVAVLDSALRRPDMSGWVPRARRMLGARASAQSRRGGQPAAPALAAAAPVRTAIDAL